MASPKNINIVIDSATLLSLGNVTIHIGTTTMASPGNIIVPMHPAATATASNTSRPHVLQKTTATSRLLSLPSELRNRIWELAFTPNIKTMQDGMLDLVTAKKPKPTLLLTCKQIYTEAYKLYTEARESFWTSTSFYINGCSLTSVRKGIESLKDENVAKIQHLSITGVPQHRFEFNNGVWGCFDACEGTSYPAHDRCARKALIVPHGHAERLAGTIKYRLGLGFGQVGHRSGAPPGCYECFSWVELPSNLKEGGVAYAKELVKWEKLTKRELLGIVAWYQERAWEAMGLA